ncbi:TIM barrel protein [Mesorhizobium sp.]|uniref:hydroxypyruvate isomerase family protein n=1 Tax=Mesorhizobium sp. TaxID=1871066 RepID=UPI0011FAB998|nr:TIM barrel protein [Mesorhizobium sp.]TIO05977.1 MAG: isomerase [Mesorhizobium sp.]TIO31339.1 MAG: isomerase [Mesorhizobium sp.]TIP12978.1 MAG: isomerase [Mesorhizobium sp.]
MPKFSANLGFLWTDRPLLDRIAAAASAGFKAVELHWPYDVPAGLVKQACEKHGVELLGINTAVGDAAKGDFGLGALPGRQSDFAKSLHQAVDYARQSGASSVHVMAGVVEPEAKPEATEVFARNLAFAAAAAPDMTLLLEPINQRDKPGYFYSTIAEAAALIERVGAPNIRIMFDVYHVGVSEGDILKRLERYLPMIGHVQIAAVPSRAEPDEGEIAYGAIFAALDRLGYAGWVGCEYRPRAGTDEGLRWMKTLQVSL